MADEAVPSNFIIPLTIKAIKLKTFIHFIIQEDS